MATIAELTAKIAQFFTASDKAHALINGADTETVSTDAGNLPTMAKAIKEFVTAGEAALAELLPIYRTELEGDPNGIPVATCLIVGGVNDGVEMPENGTANGFATFGDGVDIYSSNNFIQAQPPFWSLYIDTYLVGQAIQTGTEFPWEADWSIQPFDISEGEILVGGIVPTTPGKRCRVGDSPGPYQWFIADDLLTWRETDKALAAADMATALGYPSFADLTAANAALGIGQFYFDTTLETIQLTTA